MLVLIYFFVISGYLITSVIQSECEKGTFSLIHFYERRCRRILPALFFILFLSSFFAYYDNVTSSVKRIWRNINIYHLSYEGTSPSDTPR